MSLSNVQLLLADVAEAFASIAALSKPAARQQIILTLLGRAPSAAARRSPSAVVGDLRTIRYAMPKITTMPAGQISAARYLSI